MTSTVSTTSTSSTTESAKGAHVASSPAPAASEADFEVDMPDMAEWADKVLALMPADGSPITAFALARDLDETSPNGLWLVGECLSDLAESDTVHLEPNQLFWRRGVVAA
jgi:hypothetical protein